MKGIRRFLRDFTATAVREHLRSAIEATGGSPDLTKNEIELVRFILRARLTGARSWPSRIPALGKRRAPAPSREQSKWM
jgi:hypothetical protein